MQRKFELGELENNVIVPKKCVVRLCLTNKNATFNVTTLTSVSCDFLTMHLRLSGDNYVIHYFSTPLGIWKKIYFVIVICILTAVKGNCNSAVKWNLIRWYRWLSMNEKKKKKFAIPLLKILLIWVHLYTVTMSGFTLLWLNHF